MPYFFPPRFLLCKIMTSLSAVCKSQFLPRVCEIFLQRAGYFFSVSSCLREDVPFDLTFLSSRNRQRFLYDQPSESMDICFGKYLPMINYVFPSNKFPFFQPFFHRFLFPLLCDMISQKRENKRKVSFHFNETFSNRKSFISSSSYCLSVSSNQRRLFPFLKWLKFLKNKSDFFYYCTYI
jgi:hypothetical protein